MNKDQNPPPEIDQLESVPAEAAPDVEEPKSEPAIDYEKLSKEYLDSLKRLKAEFDNFRKRLDKERALIGETHQILIIESLLPVLDSFDASFKHVNESKMTDFIAGVHFIHDNLMAILSRLGMEKLDILNKPFDPSICEALLCIPRQDFQPGMIIEEVMPGFKFKGRLIRPAKVIVSSSSTSDGDDHEMKKQ